MKHCILNRFNVAASLIFWLSFSFSILQAAEKPNILFIAIDDLKPTLGCFGDTLVKTPSIDGLAKDATVFTRAYCQWPVCGPSRASLMTGLRPETTGVLDLRTKMRAKNPDILTLPQHLKANGYLTAGVGKVFDQRCVDNRKSLDLPSWTLPYAHPNKAKIEVKLWKLKQKNKPVIYTQDLDDSKFTDGQIRQTGIGLMRKLAKRNKPFFLAVGFQKPHLPFSAPKKYFDLYNTDNFKLASNRDPMQNATGYTMHNSNEFRSYEGVPKEGPFSDELQLKSIHAYYSCVSFIDAQVGKLLDELRNLGIADNTIVVLWGDHGFHLGDHGLWGKHSTLEQATRCPLIIRPIKGTKFTKSTSPVELVDIFPTLCEMANVPSPEQIQGRSLLPIIQGDKPSVREGAISVYRSRKEDGLAYSFRTDRYRYTEILKKGTGEQLDCELYDYKSDPHETVNIAGLSENAELKRKLAQLLREHGEGCELLSQANSQ